METLHSSRSVSRRSAARRTSARTRPASLGRSRTRPGSAPLQRARARSPPRRIERRRRPQACRLRTHRGARAARAALRRRCGVRLGLARPVEHLLRAGAGRGSRIASRPSICSQWLTSSSCRYRSVLRSLVSPAMSGAATIVTGSAASSVIRPSPRPSSVSIRTTTQTSPPFRNQPYTAWPSGLAGAPSPKTGPDCDQRTTMIGSRPAPWTRARGNPRPRSDDPRSEVYRRRRRRSRR